MMNLFEVIHSEHQKVLGGLMDLITAGTQAKRDAILPACVAHLLAHMSAEEAIFYPVLAEDADDQEPVWQALEEHRAGRCLLADLQALSTADPRFRARVKVLHDLMERHVREEEGELFPLAQEIIDEDQGLALADEFLAAQRGIPAGRPR